MNAREKAARDALRGRGILVTKKGGHDSAEHHTTHKTGKVTSIKGTIVTLKEAFKGR